MSEDAAVPLPPTVAERIGVALAAMRAHPQHHLNPDLRRAIYATFGPWRDPPASRVQAWLAILAAERVLPIYRAEWPRGITPRPEDLIALARRLAAGTLTREAKEV